jgi:Holliday junction resolvase RusA-like endonuclease
MYASSKYVAWKQQCDMLLMVAKFTQSNAKITGSFEVKILLNEKTGKGDGDNKIKAILDYCQYREIIRNDSDCRRGSWAWVEPDQAPRGCRVILRSL